MKIQQTYTKSFSHSELKMVTSFLLILTWCHVIDSNDDRSLKSAPGDLGVDAVASRHPFYVRSHGSSLMLHNKKLEAVQHHRMMIQHEVHPASAAATVTTPSSSLSLLSLGRINLSLMSLLESGKKGWRTRSSDAASHPILSVGVPAAVGIAIASLLILVVNCYKRRSEPSIPDLSDPKSDDFGGSRRNSRGEYELPSSNITKELFLPPADDDDDDPSLPLSSSKSSYGTSSSSVSDYICDFSPSGLLLSKPRGSSRGLLRDKSDFWGIRGNSSSTSTSDWFSVNDDLYKTYCSFSGDFLSSSDITSSSLLDSHRILNDGDTTDSRKRSAFSPDLHHNQPQDHISSSQHQQQKSSSLFSGSGFTFTSPESLLTGAPPKGGGGDTHSTSASSSSDSSWLNPNHHSHHLHSYHHPYHHPFISSPVEHPMDHHYHHNHHHPCCDGRRCHVCCVNHFHPNPLWW